MKHEHFISQLQKVAEKQAQLNKHRFFPKEIDYLTSLVGNYPWQFLLVVSFISTVLFELLVRFSK